MSKLARNENFQRILARLLCTCILLIFYALIDQLLIESKECKMSVANHSSTIRSRKHNGPPYSTYILSAVAKRINFTSRILNTRLPGFFNITYRNCVPYNDSRIFKTSGIAAGSLMLTYIDLWKEIGSKPAEELDENEWVFIFEDDVDLVPLHILKDFYNKTYTTLNFSNVSYPIAGIIEHGLALAVKEGMIYLGTCGPTYTDSEADVPSYVNSSVTYRRGFYYCTHAIAYTKWRARSIWDELAAYRLIHNEAGADTIIRQWQRLSSTHPISIATNIEWPTHTGHFGFFYQARGLFNSIIQQTI